MSKILIDNLFKTYSGDNSSNRHISVIEGMDLEIQEGELVTFFGPNGCGKTTLINIIAGIEPFDSGKVLIDSKSPEEARTGVIFQAYNDSLMPWLTCYDNILFPFNLKRRKKDFLDAKRRLDELISDLNISLPYENYTYQLSGGQKQLVAIIRTLLYNPDVILMDEPFSSLDFQTRHFMQEMLLTIWEKTRPTILFVSHDIEEAIYLADRLVLLKPIPTSINQVIKIPFKRPRNENLFRNRSFYQLKVDCLKQMSDQSL